MWKDILNKSYFLADCHIMLKNSNTFYLFAFTSFSYAKKIEREEITKQMILYRNNNKEI